MGTVCHSDSLTPIAEKLGLVPHAPDGLGCAKLQDAAQLLAKSETLKV